MRLTCATRESRYDPGSVPSRMIRRMTSRCHEQPYQRLPLTLFMPIPHLEDELDHPPSGATQSKLEASSVLPMPWYFAI